MEKTYYASPEKADKQALGEDVDAVVRSAVISKLLETVSGLVAVVNEHRQVVAVNTSFLNHLGIENEKGVLGLRPGEVVRCVHACEEPAGCGTTMFCSTCGAAVAMVTGLSENRPVECKCTIRAQKDGCTSDVVLMVNVSPVEIEGKCFLLLFLQDITASEQRAALERTFFHDINNTASMLLGASDLLSEEYPGHLSKVISKVSKRLINEIALQRCLTRNESGTYTPVYEQYMITTLFDDLELAVSNHPASKGKIILIDRFGLGRHADIVTDRSLVMRILCNMVINALEAIPAGESIRIYVTNEETTTIFHVWNNGVIPPEIARRVFQRYFSTKGQPGRGIGTYSMKLFGEKFLNGVVDFSSTAAGGTEFRLALPVRKV